VNRWRVTVYHPGGGSAQHANVTSVEIKDSGALALVVSAPPEGGVYPHAAEAFGYAAGHWRSYTALPMPEAADE